MPTSEFFQTASQEEIQRSSPDADPIVNYYRLPSYRRAFTRSEVIKGDFKSPNPWSYNVTASTTWNGKYIVEDLRYEKPFFALIVTGQVSGERTGVALLDTATVYYQTRNDALERLSEKVRGSLDLATSLAESGQAVKMLNLVDRLTRGMADMKRSWKREILDQLRTFKKRRQAAAALQRWQRGVKARNPGSYRPQRAKPGMAAALLSGTTKSLANGWCEYTYGWNPLISDIKNIANNVVGFVHNKCVVKASATQSLDQQSVIRGYVFNAWYGDVPSTYKGFIKHTIKIRLDPGFDSGLGRWTSLNPLAVAWELFPYSFVVDWVFDIGSYMRNLETSLLYGTKFLDGMESTLVKYTGTAEVNSRYDSGGGTPVTFVARGGTEISAFSRSLIFSYPAPTLPSFKLDLGSNRLLSAAALLRQLIR